MSSENRESEPLLGRPGDVLQKEDELFIANFYKGTATLALLGSALLVGLVWGAVFTNPLLPLFSPHPLLQSVGVLAMTGAVLVLQPTWTPRAKVVGARVHASLNLLSFLCLASGVAMIEFNKFSAWNPHFKSTHAYLGVAAAVLLLAQYLFGLLMWAAPALFGGVDQAKALWRYHRWSGYVVALPLVLATTVSASGTDYNVNVLDIKAWALLASAALIVLGVYPRIHIKKLGLRPWSERRGAETEADQRNGGGGVLAGRDLDGGDGGD